MIRATLIALAILIAAGCGNSANTARDQALKPDHDHDHDHDDAEHVHRPKNLARAVTDLRRRTDGLRRSLQHGRPSDAAIQACRDLIRLLPDVAADSDLKRSDWEAVSRIAKDLDRWSAGADLVPEKSQLDGLLSQLEKLGAGTERVQLVKTAP